MKRFALTAAVALAAFSATPALAQAAGDTVTGNDGVAIGTIESNDGTNFVLNIGEYQMALPSDLLGEGETGPTLNITRGQLIEMHEAALAEAAAALETALVEGAAVVTADPAPLGTVDTISGDNVVIAREDESLVTLPRAMFAVDPSGALVALITMADLEAALAAQAG